MLILGLQSTTFVVIGVVLLALAMSSMAVAGEAALDERAALASVDLRPAFAKWGLPQRLQGGRGTCSVFTMTGAIEYALASRKGEGVVLSVEFLNWAANDAMRRWDDGAFFSDLWRGFAMHGICPEADAPYQAEYVAKRRPAEAAMKHALEVRQAGLRLHWIKEWDVKTGLTEAQFQRIKRVLAQQWPVCGGFRWPKKEAWDDGVLRMAPPEEVFDGHSVLLVGYRDDERMPGGGVFLVRNSGGGVHDGAIPYAYVKAYMNDAAWVDFEPAAPPNARPAMTGLLTPLGPAPAGRNQRASSNEQPAWNDGNMDMAWLMPGESVEMPLFDGPGVITHMWFTSHAGWVGELNALVLRIYWDGSDTPAVEAPLADFFAVGQGKPAPVESIPVQVSPTGSLSCCWRMPFHRSARVVVTNENPDRSTGLYWQVDWVKLDEALPENTPYFHARYRQEHPAIGGRDYRIADIEGAGFYVGTVLSVTNAQDGWFGEGDDYFYIDGEAVPSLQGTGTEDYFNDAWGFRPRRSAWFGQPRWEGDRAGDSGVCYRWHLPDAVYFAQSLRVEIEHKGNCVEDTDGFYVERPDFLSSVAFWYQTGQAKAFGGVLAWNQRRVPWEIHHFVRAFRNVRASGDEMPRVATTGFFGARPVLAWQGVSGAELAAPFAVAEEGRYAMRLTAGTAPDGGAFEVLLDGRAIGALDGRSAEPGEADVALGTHQLPKGEHAIAFRIVRAGALAVEMLRSLRLPPEARRAVRDHNEAHFVRLAIGRAVYAYRLAFDALPESLRKLVESGILSSRYMNDENGRPLIARVENGFFAVRGEAWEHRWQGLDARR